MTNKNMQHFVFIVSFWDNNPFLSRRFPNSGLSWFHEPISIGVGSVSALRGECMMFQKKYTRYVYSLMSFLVFSAVFISFQNCSQVQPSLDTSNSPPSSQAVIRKIETQNYSFLSFPVHPDDIEFASFIKLNLLSNEFDIFSYSRDRGEFILCDRQQMLESLFQSFQHLLTENPLCFVEKQKVLPPDMNCTQKYEPPYAVFNSDPGPFSGLTERDNDFAKNLAVGEARDGCSTPTDLCNEKGVELRKLIQKFRESSQSQIENQCGK